MRTLYILSLVIFTFLHTNIVFAQTSTDNCPGKDQALETLGGASGMLLYNTYIAIGAVADGGSDGVYEDSYVIALMEEQIAAMNVLDTQYTELSKSGFLTDPSDKKYVEDIIKTIHYLKNEAYYLKQYTSNGLQSDLDEYNYARNSSWDMIKELLGIEED